MVSLGMKLQTISRLFHGLAAAALFVAVFPANVQMAVDWRSRPAAEQAAAYARLPLQIPLVLWAWKVRRDASANPEVAKRSK